MAEKKKRRRLKGEGSVYLRGNTYWIQYRADGKVYRESAQTDKKMEAIDLPKTKVGEIALGRKPSREFAKTTFEDLKELYLKNFEEQGKRDKRRAEIALGHLEGNFKSFRATEITKKQIEEYSRKRSQEVNPNTVNRELSVLRAMFNLGVEDEMVSPDRVPVIKMHPAGDPRQGFIERDQYGELLSFLPDWFKPVLTFAFQTG